MVGLRLRVVLGGVSPLIVRTIDVPAWLSLAALNRVLLECFGWSGEALHRFDIRGRRYSDRLFVDADNSRDVLLGSFGLRPGERFWWSYDFNAGWIMNCRVEAVVDDIDTIRCVSGRRRGPPEWCSGPVGFQEWEDSHSVFEFVDDIAAIGDTADSDRCGDLTDEELICRLRTVSVWILRDGFDKAGLNERLSMLEVPSCVSLSRSASKTTPSITVSR